MLKFPEKIVTKNTMMRRITLQDAAGWKSFNNAIAKVTKWPHVPSIVYARNELLHYHRMWDSGEHYVYIVLDKAGNIIGDFHLKDIEKNRVEFGHALHPRVWGTGITYELMDAMRKVAKQLSLTLWGRTEEENVRAWKSLEKYNAKYLGTKTFTINKEKKKMRVYEL